MIGMPSAFALGIFRELAKALIAQQEIGHGHGAHEGCGNGGNPVVLLLVEQVHGSGPQHNHSQRLVSPAEVTPDNGVVNLAQRVANAQNGAHAQNRHAQQHRLCNFEP